MGPLGSKSILYNSEKLLICPKCWKQMPELIILDPPYDTPINLLVKCQCTPEGQETSIAEYLDSIAKLQLPKEHFCFKHPQVEGVQYCTQCSCWYCQECLPEHKKTSKKHQVCDYEFNVVCQCDKSKLQFSHYCEYCLMNLCEKCKGKEEHKTHQVIPIPSIDPTQIEQDFAQISKLLSQNEETINMFILKLFNNNEKQTLEEKRSKEQEIGKAFEHYQAVTETFQSFFEHLLSTKKFCKANPNYFLNKLFLTLKINLQQLKLSFAEFNKSSLAVSEYLKSNFILSHRAITEDEENVFAKVNRKTSNTLFSNDIYDSMIVALVQLNKKTLVSVSGEGEITQWNPLNFKRIKRMRLGIKVQCSILLENGQLACVSDKAVFLINCQLGRVMKKWEANEVPIACLIQLKDKSVALALKDKSVKIWKSVETDEWSIINSHESDINCLVEYKAGYLVAGYENNAISFWKILDTTSMQTVNEHKAAVRCLIKLSNYKVVSGSDDKSIKIWDSDSYICLATLQEHIGPVICLTELDDKKFASGSRDKEIKIWDINTHEYKNSLVNNKEAVYSLVSLSNGLLVSASSNAMTVWDI